MCLISKLRAPYNFQIYTTHIFIYVISFVFFCALARSLAFVDPTYILLNSSACSLAISFVLFFFCYIDLNLFRHFQSFRCGMIRLRCSHFLKTDFNYTFCVCVFFVAVFVFEKKSRSLFSLSPSLSFFLYIYTYIHAIALNAITRREKKTYLTSLRFKWTRYISSINLLYIFFCRAMTVSEYCFVFKSIQEQNSCR